MKTLMSKLMSLLVVLVLFAAAATTASSQTAPKIRLLDKLGAESKIAVGLGDTDAEPPSNEIRCRGYSKTGGSEYVFSTIASRPSPTGETIITYEIGFTPSVKAAGTRGEGLQPGECSFVDRPISESGPYRIRFETPANAQLRQQLHGTPVDTSPTAAERFPDAQTIPAYMNDPRHYWSFFGPGPVNNFYTATGNRYWKPGRPDSIGAQNYKVPQAKDSDEITATNPHRLGGGAAAIDSLGVGAVSEKVNALQPANTVKLEVRYNKEYGYKFDSGAFGGGPTSCDAFFVSAGPDPSVRLEHLYAIHKMDQMRESDSFYVCDFLVTDLPLNAPIKVGVDLVDHRIAPFEAWKGGSQAQPPPGAQRTIIIVGGKASGISGAEAGNFTGQDGTRTVTLTETQPRAALVFEMVYVYAGPTGEVGTRRRHDVADVNKIKQAPGDASSDASNADKLGNAEIQGESTDFSSSRGLKHSERIIESSPYRLGSAEAPATISAQDLDDLEAKGGPIANADPLALALRNQQPEGPARRGFDIGMAAAEKDTLPGPGKERIHDALKTEEQGGYDTAVSYSLEHNKALAPQ